MDKSGGDFLFMSRFAVEVEIFISCLEFIFRVEIFYLK